MAENIVVIRRVQDVLHRAEGDPQGQKHPELHGFQGWPRPQFEITVGGNVYDLTWTGITALGSPRG